MYMRTKVLIISVLIQMFSSLLTFAQVKFRFSDGIYDQALKKQVENNVSAFLTEINRADSSNRTLNLAKIKMSKEASERLSMLWRYMPFCCEWENNVQSCVQDFTGYEIRQIPIVLKPLDNTYKGESHKELTISFNKQGIITGVRTSIDNNSYLALLSGGKANLDMRMRREILKYLEDCRSYYTEKDINAIAKMLGFCSFDVKKSLAENCETPVRVSLKKNECSVKDKQEYLSNLNKYFQQDGCIVAKISDIELMRHAWNPYFYGVNFRLQLSRGDGELQSATGGYYFLLWDFTEEANPKIHFCLLFSKKDEILSPEDFFIPHN